MTWVREGATWHILRNVLNWKSKPIHVDTLCGHEIGAKHSAYTEPNEVPESHLVCLFCMKEKR